ncbi:uncharacterized protein [Pseudochaenichthys georgianus]|uniref:uncharacterized protein isoform X1 n=1 Tax=Pseudochaenichthys georgianus TaxID=52239 RepID=UPI00146D2870|nr:uncharacterized protein LOC117461409 isoform X1 [Pseudochaenichthys georgianus]
MQSQGNTSSQPSIDSLSAGDSLLCSDSEQAEDESDVFLTAGSPVIIGGVGGAKANGDGGSESPGSQWTCDGSTDKEEEEELNKSEKGGKAACIRLDQTDPSKQNPKSQGDLLFAQKCAELQGFVRPLLELLNGLKRGRFDQGLTTFQQSVAMDRIQRIVGVLQKPHSGEKYMNTLLQVEVMLKIWFPQIQTQSVSAGSSFAASPARSPQETPPVTPPHKYWDQSHIPVKKRRLSWTGTDSPTPSPVLFKCSRISVEEKKVNQECDERKSPLSSSLAPDANPDSPMAGKDQLNGDIKRKDSDREELGKQLKYKAGQNSEPSLTWVHVAPILSPRKPCASHEGTTVGGNNENKPVNAVLLPPRRRGQPATQDRSVTSSSVAKHPKHLKKPSQPVTGQQSGSDTAETCQGQSAAPQVTLTPLPEVCPTPLKT